MKLVRTMFRKLFDFGYKRSALEAVGFYLAWLLPVLVILNVVPFLVVRIYWEFQGIGNSLEKIFAFFYLLPSLSRLIGSLICIGLSLRIIQLKGLFGQPLPLPLGLSSGLVNLALGPVLGLIPVAWLTTRPSQREQNTSGTMKELRS